MDVDRSGVAMMAHVLAGIESASITAPPALEGEALAMFEQIVAGNRTRAWNASHALALADYCRVSILWGREVASIELEGVMVDGKMNRRMSAIEALSRERVKLARILGITVGKRDGLVNPESSAGRLRAVGSRMQDTLAGDKNGLLA